MKKTIGKKIYDHLNEEFRTKMPLVLTEEFGKLGFTTEYNLFAGTFGGLVTGWKKKVSPEKRKAIKKFVDTYEKGFTDAMNMVYWYENSRTK